MYRCLFIYHLYWQLKLRLAYASIQVIYDHRQTRNSCDIIHQPLCTILHQNDKSSFLQQALVVRHIFPALALLLWAKWSTSSKTTTLPVLVLDVVADLSKSCHRGKTSFLLKPSLSCSHFPRKTAHLKCEFKRIETIKKNCMIFFYEYQQQNTDCFRVYACYSLTILFHYSYSDSYVFFNVD